MPDYPKRIVDQELDNSNKVTVALLIGVVVIMGMWFLRGILYIISL